MNNQHSSMENIEMKLLCQHRWWWDHNIYGDEINAMGGKRSIWKCHLCGKTKAKPYLMCSTEVGDYDNWPEGWVLVSPEMSAPIAAFATHHDALLFVEASPQSDLYMSLQRDAP